MGSVTKSDPPGMACSDGWRITGYYLPDEADFGGEPEEITVEGMKPDTFPSDFIKDTKMEGWGLTRYGWFLGWSRGNWVQSPFAQNSHGKPLQIGSLAADPNQIAQGTTVRIISAPSPWDNQNFIVDDTGGAIKGKHLDIYCGTGATARKETFRVTSNTGRVCL